MKGLHCLALMGGLLISNFAHSAPFNTASLDFDFTISRPPLAVDLTPHPGKEIVVFGRNTSQAQQIAVVALIDGKLEQVDRFAIGEQYFGYDVSESSEQTDTLYFLAQDHIAQYQYPQNKGDARLISFVDVHSIYRIASSNYMRRMDFIYDFNNDGQSDVMLTDFNETHVWLSVPDKEHKKVSLPIQSHTVLDRDEFSASPAQVFAEDVNNDQLIDVSYLKDGKLHVHLAHKRHFEEVTLAVRDDIYAIDWWDQLGEDGQPLDQSDLQYRKLERFEDVNGDKLPDLVVRFTKSSGVFDRVNDYEIYYAQQSSDGQLSYAKDANTVISAEGTLTDLQLQDIDGDGIKEVMVASFELGVGQIVSALLASSIDQDILLYWQDKQGKFPKEPTLDYETQMSFSISKGRASEPLVLLSDINGDGRKDLLFSKDSDELIYRLNEGAQSFARSKRHKAPLPQSGVQVSSADINEDKKDDLIIYYSKLDSLAQQKRLSVMIAP
ncbi:FG-GAP repeat domain-containing protein [Pseudoalteromonas sp. SSDWG2]|uniref:FG-GAP repeat domain-containing protein n=1 Tax=Pseudoalteromonas sp. SSDWG2 TaxID=3139391 RepID=UPI003BA87EB1